MYRLEVVWGAMDSIGLIVDRDTWQAFANAMNLKFPQNADNFFTS
jgi:hypothetical protein